MKNKEIESDILPEGVRVDNTDEEAMMNKSEPPPIKVPSWVVPSQKDTEEN